MLIDVNIDLLIIIVNSVTIINIRAKDQNSIEFINLLYK